MDGLQRVPVVGGADDDGVNVLPREELAVIEELFGPGADLLRGEIEVRLVDVTDGGDLAILVLEEGVENLVAAVAQADEAEAEPLVGAEDAAGAGGGQCGGTKSGAGEI